MRKTAFILCMLLCLLTFTTRVHAQNILSNGTAIGIPISGKVDNGDIITSTPNGYKLSNSPYDPQIFGVVSLNPAVYLKNSTAKNDIPVISQGQVLIRVSNKNGNITSGDYVTSS